MGIASDLSKDREFLDRICNVEKRLQIVEQMARSQSKTIRQGSMMLLIMVILLAIVIALFLSIRQDIQKHIPDEL